MFAKLFFLLCLINVNFCLAQNCLDVILQDKLYSNTDAIINGRKWINEKKYSGTPLLMEKYWPAADIVYNGTHFPNQLMNYDLYKDEMIIYRSENGRIKFVIINKDKLTGFTYTDTIDRKKHSFEYMELPGTSGKALYENASAGAIMFYIKPMKKVEIKSTGRTQGQFTAYYDYYINKGGRFFRITSKNQLLELMPDHEADLNRYMREKRFKINNEHPEKIIYLVNFMSKLN